MVRWMPVAFLAWLFFPVFAVADGGLSDTAVEEEVGAILQSNEISLGDLFRIARLRNPELGAARNAVTTSSGRMRQAGLYPNPIVEFEVEDLSTSDFGRRNDKVSLVQPLVISGRLGDAVASARADKEASAHALAQARRGVLRRIHALWAEHIYFRETESELADLLAVARQTLEIAETRFASRAAPESQVTKALLEVFELETAGQRLTQQRARAAAELSAMLGGTDVPLDRIVNRPEGDGSIAEALAWSLDSHPAVAAAASRVEAAAASLREAEAERIPDLGVFVSYGRARPAGRDFIEAGLSIPIPLFSRNQGRVTARRALVAEAREERRRIEGDLRASFAAARARYRAVGDELRAIVDRMAPAAERGLRQAREGYRVGRLPFLELIDAQRTFSNIRLRTLELRRDLTVAEADLLSLAGVGPYDDTGE